jgi:hypothetical protein
MDDPKNLETVHIQWLVTPGNYSKYRGKNISGKRKLEYADEIAKKIIDAGDCVKQDKDKVKAKLSHMKKYFRSAYDFTNTESGAGMKTTDEGNKDQMLMKFPWYFNLLDVFQDRASDKPKWQVTCLRVMKRMMLLHLMMMMMMMDIFPTHPPQLIVFPRVAAQSTSVAGALALSLSQERKESL